MLMLAKDACCARVALKRRGFLSSIQSSGRPFVVKRIDCFNRQPGGPASIGDAWKSFVRCVPPEAAIRASCANLLLACVCISLMIEEESCGARLLNEPFTPDVVVQCICILVCAHNLLFLSCASNVHLNLYASFTRHENLTSCVHS